MDAARGAFDTVTHGLRAGGGKTSSLLMEPDTAGVRVSNFDLKNFPPRQASGGAAELTASQLRRHNSEGAKVDSVQLILHALESDSVTNSVLLLR